MLDGMTELERLLPSRGVAGGHVEPVSDPPRRLSALNLTRRIGIEIRFAGVTPEDAAETVAASTNGLSARTAEDRFRVEGGLLDAIELRIGEAETLRPHGTSLHECDVVPIIELVTDPVPYTRLQQFNLAVDALRRAGARNTAAYGLAAYGTHLNVEIADADVTWLTRVMKSYALAERWLRQQLLPIGTRRIMSRILPWPSDYVELLLAPEYWPSLGRLIDDYAAHSPTQYRDLDLLPLFACLDPDRIAAAELGLDIVARQAFHFRLPDTRIAEEGWSPVVPWNLWVRVEQLADDTVRFERLSDCWRRHRDDDAPAWRWPEIFADELPQ
jgi:Putative amidoligase enzyme